MSADREVRVGCSGWEYKHWRGDFYPTDLPRRLWLEYYAERFDTVEINNSFYRLPSVEGMREWRRRVPPDFLFAVKASRFLTHMRKLKDPADPLHRLFESVAGLGRKRGPVLYQLPPGWKPNPERLAAFIAALPRARHVVEFRDPTWYRPDIFDILAKGNVALCLHDMPSSATERVAIGPFIYVRFHGSGAKYGGGYPRDALEEWAAWLTQQSDGGRDVYAYFNNDVGGHAPRDAVVLRDAMRGARGRSG